MSKNDSIRKLIDIIVNDRRDSISGYCIDPKMQGSKKCEEIRCDQHKRIRKEKFREEMIKEYLTNAGIIKFKDLKVQKYNYEDDIIDEDEAFFNLEKVQNVGYNYIPINISKDKVSYDIILLLNDEVPVCLFYIYDFFNVENGKNLICISGHDKVIIYNKSTKEIEEFRLR